MVLLYICGFIGFYFVATCPNWVIFPKKTILLRFLQGRKFRNLWVRGRFVFYLNRCRCNINHYKDMQRHAKTSQKNWISSVQSFKLILQAIIQYSSRLTTINCTVYIYIDTYIYIYIYQTFRSRKFRNSTINQN